MSGIYKHRITKWLESNSEIYLTLYTSIAAFSLYTSVYAFRKAFPAATFEGHVFLNIHYKVWLVLFQAIGYALSKFAGIKIISELKAAGRKQGIILLTSIAGLCWLLFGAIPKPYNIPLLLLNGLSLGLIWGIVFSYLEGRRVTEVLGAALSISFIFSSGLCRTVGSFLIHKMNVSEEWMPFLASALFVLPLLLSLHLLDKVPPPTIEDENSRTRRSPMNTAQRKEFLRTFLPGIVFFVLCYVLLTTFRDFRDNFSAEVWKSLGAGNSPGVYTRTEVPVSILILIVMGSVMAIKNNYQALVVNHIIIGLGLASTAIATYLFEQKHIQGEFWMMLIGLGLYMGYVPFNSIFFDRLLATFRWPGTAGFVMYVADSFGYLGSVAILLYKEFALPSMQWLQVFVYAAYLISFTGLILICGSGWYFHHKYLARRAAISGNEQVALT